MHPAQYFLAGEKASVRCLLCPHECIIPDGAAGRCRARVNSGGVLYARTYGAVPSLALDPIEKKPLAHFYPGSYILSAGNYGCNLSCLFCQNHEISQTGGPVSGDGTVNAPLMSPARLVETALEYCPRKNIGIAYTYNEPLVGYEYVYETAVLAREAGLKNVLVTNGYVNAEPMEKLLPFIDAMNIDLKAFTDGFYQKICGGHLQPVLDTICLCARFCHVEVTTLVIPGLNSLVDEIESLAAWVASVSSDITLHLNAHHPDYRMSEPPPIPADDLRALAAAARAHLRQVQCGNIRV